MTLGESTLRIHSSEIKKSFRKALSDILGLEIRPDIELPLDDEIDDFMTEIKAEEMDEDFANQFVNTWRNSDLPSYEELFEVTEALMDHVFRTRKWKSTIIGRNFSATTDDDKAFMENFSVDVRMPPKHFEKYLADQMKIS